MINSELAVLLLGQIPHYRISDYKSTASATHVVRCLMWFDAQLIFLFLLVLISFFVYLQDTAWCFVPDVRCSAFMRSIFRWSLRNHVLRIFVPTGPFLNCFSKLVLLPTHKLFAVTSLPLAYLLKLHKFDLLVISLPSLLMSKTLLPLSLLNFDVLRSVAFFLLAKSVIV